MSVLKCFLILCIFVTFVEISCVDLSNKWKDVIDRTRYLMKSNSNLLTKSSQPTYNDGSCYNDTIEFYAGIEQSSLLAVKMFDSWGNFPSGILSGNVHSLGHFDECINVNVATQYCLLEIEIENGNSSRDPNNRVLALKPEILHFKNPINILVGTCYPSSCSPVLTAALYQNYLNLDNVLVRPSNINCYIGDSSSGFEFTPMQILTICLFGVIAVLMLTSTITEFFMEIEETNVLLKMWKAFSVCQNLPFVCDTQNSKNERESKFACLDGLRAISITWVAYGHTVFNTQRSPLINGNDIAAWSENLWSIISTSTFNFAVDTFFVIGGFLATRSISNQFERDQRPFTRKFFSIPRMWLHRYIRLAPVVISTLLFFTTIGTKLGSGPFWNYAMQEIELCHNNWWSTVLFIQNYASAGKMCLGHLWYLAVDIQMFMITSILIFLIRWKSIKFLWIGFFMILANIANNIYWYVDYDFQWVSSKAPQTVNERNAVTYYPTHARMGSWIVGVFLAIIYSKCLKGRQSFKIPLKILLTGYIVCVVALGAIVAVISYMTKENVVASNLVNAFFDAFSRLTWAIVIAFIVFQCTTKNGGPVNTILSSPIWKPLAKLSFCIYVLHYVIQLLKIAQNRTMVYMDNFSLIERFWSDFGISVTVSVLWTLAFEIPFRIIDQIEWKRPIISNITNHSHVNEAVDVDTEN